MTIVTTLTSPLDGTHADILPDFSRGRLTGRGVGAWLSLGASEAHGLKRITPVLVPTMVLVPTIMLTVLSVLGTVIIWASTAAW